MRALAHYLDADPVRRRIRFAIVVAAVAGILWLWVPPIVSARSHYAPVVTQGQADAACAATTNPFDRGVLCPNGAPVNARAYDAGEATRARFEVRESLQAPIPPTFALLVATAILWILAPLLSTRK